MNGRTRRGGTDRGSGSVLMAAVIAVVLIVTASVLLLAAAATASTQARAAADLAALAGAADRVRGTGVETGCATAARVSALNRARLLGCHAVGTGLQVTVAVDVRPRAAGRVIGRPAQARSLAGPDPSGALVARDGGTIDP